VARLEIKVPPVPSSVPSSRHQVRAWLEELPLDPDTCDDVLVVVSELVTNGVIHNGGEAIAVSVTGDPSGVSLEVETADRGKGGPPPFRQISDPVEGGRGLALVSALADTVVTVARSGRRRVRCHVSARATPSKI
jgi:anti-sigma regulatory factor (Ser/Thr protein kinase)